MSAKTPVSVLQEMSAIKKIQPPQYDLIFNRSDGVNPEFKFRVTFGNIVEAVGTGRSKKEAKHNAAETALRKLKEQDSRSLQDPIISPYSNQVQRNYVGELMTYCADRPPLEAKFEEHGAEGPSHAPSFTLKCTVSKFVEIAEASTKKQAKQLVAKKMLQRIQKCLKDVVVPQPKETNDELKERTTAEMKTVYQKLRDHPRLPTTVIPNSISELHSVLKQNYTMPEPLMTLHVERDTAGWNPIQKVKDVADTMNVKFRMDIYKGVPKGSGAWFAVATLDANPPVTVIAHGSSEKEAKNKTADDLLSHLVDMLKD